MVAHAYTVDEIDELRSAVETIWLFGSLSPGNCISRSYMANEKELAVEQRVRTYMIAGVTATSLYDREAKNQRAWRDAENKRIVDTTIQKNISGSTCGS